MAAPTVVEHLEEARSALKAVQERPRLAQCEDDVEADDKRRRDAQQRLAEHLNALTIALGRAIT